MIPARRAPDLARQIESPKVPKLTITIEDTPDGAVLITGDPSADEVRALAEFPNNLTPAQGYLLVAWQAMLAAGKEEAARTGGQVEVVEYSDDTRNH